MSDKVVEPLRVFEFCNSPLNDINGQYRGDCPLCGERSHLFVSPEGKWDCKKCMEAGNIYTFIRSWHQSLLADSPDAYLDLVSLRPGIGKAMFRHSQIAFDGTSWILPAYSVKEGVYKVISLRRWIPETKEMLSCPTLSQGLYIAKWTDNPEGRVWITEGEWDALAWARCVSKVGEDDIVVSVPGAGSWPDRYLGWISGREVRFLYDNDAPKERKNKILRPGFDGMHRVVDKALAMGTSSVLLCGWKDTDAPMDVRDYVISKGNDIAGAFNDINSMLVTPDEFRSMHGYSSKTTVTVKQSELPPPVNSYDELIDEFRKVYEVSEMFEKCIACALATCVSNLLQGDQLWMFLVGPPSCLSGDNIVKVNRGGKTFDITLRDLYHRFHGGIAGGRVWKEEIETRIQQRNLDGTVRLAKIHNVMYSGEKVIYELTTERGNVIKASADHKFMSPDGTWIRLKDLRIGDYVLSNQGRSNRGTKRRRPARSVCGLIYHPHASKRKSVRSEGWTCLEHRLVVEAEINNLSYDSYIYTLRYDEQKAKTFKFLPPNVHVHHVNRDNHDNRIENLEVIHQVDHHKLHSFEDHAYRHVLEYCGKDRIVSIKELGIEHVYDLTVDDPHNFLCENIVVHNSGKTSIIEAFAKAHRYTFHLSKLTSQALVSGQNRGEDPSILPKLTNKCLFVKDFTAILALPAATQEELFGMLRDAYDRNVRVQYGNGAVRIYQDLNFTLFAGCTDEIYAKNHSSLGERFLKIEILDASFSPTAQARAALMGLNTKIDLTQVQTKVYGYLRHLYESFTEPGPVDEETTDWLVSVAAIVSYLRTKVRREEGNMAFRPRSEVPTRIAMQLRKLYLSLKIAAPAKEESWYREVVEKVAMDSCIGWALEFVAPILKKKVGVTTQEIADMCQVAPNHVVKVLRDMQQIGIVTSELGANNTGRPGRQTNYWLPDERFLELWETAAISRKAVKKFTPSRKAKRSRS